MTCVSRPRRSGKSYAAKMLCAYYDRSCDSSALFDDLEIAATRNLLPTGRRRRLQKA
ncbi:MAG: AAA family ATPase [Lachnospiraceae bacterium]